MTSEPLWVPTVAIVSEGGARRQLPGRAAASTRGGVTSPAAVPDVPWMPLRGPVRSIEPAAEVARTSTISSNAVVAVCSVRLSGRVVFMALSASVDRSVLLQVSALQRAGATRQDKIGRLGSGHGIRYPVRNHPERPSGARLAAGDRLAGRPDRRQGKSAWMAPGHHRLQRS